MAESIGDITKKKRGRKVTTGTREGVLVRLPPELLAGLGSFAEAHMPSASRPEVIRYGLTEWLTSLGYLKPASDDPEMAN